MTYIPSNDRYDSMVYNRCGKSGLKLPAISLGLWHNFGGEELFENGRGLIRKAFDLGDYPFRFGQQLWSASGFC